MVSYFQKYWNNLKKNNPEKYQEKLKINRERIRRKRRELYKDKAKHAAYKQKQRERYRQLVAAKKSTVKADASKLPKREDIQTG